MDGSDAAIEKPDWWLENERLRAMFDLPSYDPPRFEDGVYTHEVVPDIEAEHGIEVRFVGEDTNYPDDWTVRVDGEPVMRIGRHRNENGNTVYEMSASAFREALESALFE